MLDWEKRVRIAAGAARGIAYLHEDCNYQPLLLFFVLFAEPLLLYSLVMQEHKCLSVNFILWKFEFFELAKNQIRRHECELMMGARKTL